MKKILKKVFCLFRGHSHLYESAGVQICSRCGKVSGTPRVALVDVDRFAEAMLEQEKNWATAVKALSLVLERIESLERVVNILADIYALSTGTGEETSDREMEDRDRLREQLAQHEKDLAKLKKGYRQVIDHLSAN